MNKVKTVWLVFIEDFNFRKLILMTTNFKKYNELTRKLFETDTAYSVESYDKELERK